MYIARTALVALTLSLTIAGSARAQVGPDATVFGRPDPERYEYGRPRRPPPPDVDDDRPRRAPPPPPDDDYDRPRRPPPPPRFGDDRPRYRGRVRSEQPQWRDSVCVTARGTCMTPSAPPNAPCGCAIPGFGYKRGQIAD
jgi:hypothetical protein